MGQGSSAIGTNSTAIGQGAIAAGNGSTAIGNGAVALAPNQIAVGTSSNIYKMAGVTSAASLAAQVGPTSFVTSDANGNLATSSFGPQNLASMQSQLSSLQSQVLDNRLEARTGTALALAVGATPSLQAGRRFGISASYGNFQGTNAFGVGATGLLYDTKNYAVVVNAGAGLGVERNLVGVRTAVGLQW
jgi:hypothetical protein